MNLKSGDTVIKKIFLLNIPLLFSIIIPNFVIAQTFPFSREPDWIPDEHKARAYDIAFADVNLDGWLDFVCSEEAEVYYNLNGELQTSVGWSSSNAFGWRMDLGDIDRDGDLDMAMGSYSVGERVHYNQNGIFEDSPSWVSDLQSRCRQIELADIDMDGKLDLVSIKEDAIVVFYNQGSRLETSPSWRSQDGAGMGFTLGDIDNDGDFDLIVACGDNGVKVYINNGNSFGSNASWSLPSEWAYSTNLVDVNNDGLRDITVGCSAGVFQIFLNKNGSFSETPDQTLSLSSEIIHHHWMDVDNDNDLDLIWSGAFDRQKGAININENGIINEYMIWVTPGSEEINFAFADIDASHLIMRQEMFDGDGKRKLYYLGKTPIHFINKVVIDGDIVKKGNYHFDRNAGWVSFAKTPSSGNQNVSIEYTYSPYFDLAICYNSKYDYLSPYGESGMVIFYNRWPAPSLKFISHKIKDNLGNHDGNLDPGETAELSVAFHSNGPSNAKNSTAFLSTSDPFITFIDSSISMGTIPSGDTLVSPNPFQISLPSETPDPYGAWFQLNFKADDFNDSTFFPIRIGDSTGFYDNVETNNAKWHHQNISIAFNDQWHISHKRNHTQEGNRSWKCGDPGNQNYLNKLDAGLITHPVLIDTNSYLKFWHWIDTELTEYPGTAWDGGIVEISNDGGKNWKQIKPVGGYPYKIEMAFYEGPFDKGIPCFSGKHDWKKAIVSLHEYSGQEVQFRFRFGTDTGITMEGWYIDDIMVESSHLKKDIGVVSIISPDSMVQFNEQISPTVLLFNFGLEIQDFSVKIEIKKNSTMYYADSIFVSSMHPHEERKINFKSWNPDEAGSYLIKIQTLLNGDQNRTNDILTSTTTTRILSFQDITRESEVFGTLRNGATGMAWGDYNNDGYQDIYITYGGQSQTIMKDILFENLSDGTFKNISASANIQSSEYSSGVALGDYDNDGYLDIFVSDLFSTNQSLFHNNGGNNFENVINSAGMENLNKMSTCSWADVDNDGFIDLYIGSYEVDGRSMLFLNNHNGTFQDISQESNAGYSGQNTGIAFGDYDNDSDQDLFLCSLIPRGKNLLLENDGNGNFTDNTNDAGLQLNRAGFTSACWGDYNNDGYLDLIVTNASSIENKNYLLRNNGNGTFTDVTSKANIVSSLSNSAAWGDYDNDGYLDLYIATQNNYHDHLLHNCGDGSFEDVSTQFGLSQRAATMGATWADYDRDGFLDLYVTRFSSRDSSKNVLYKNHGNGNNWLVVELIGKKSNSSGIGARLSLFADTLFCIREVNGGLGTFQNSLPAEFGIGTINRIDSLVINWPSGIVDTYTNIQPNQYVTAIEGNKLISDINDNKKETPVPNSYLLKQNYPNPFNSETTITITLPEPVRVAVRIYDILGREIETLVNKKMKAGSHKFIWNASNFPSGLYLYTMETTFFCKTTKMILMK